MQDEVRFTKNEMKRRFVKGYSGSLFVGGIIYETAESLVIDLNHLREVKFDMGGQIHAEEEVEVAKNVVTVETTEPTPEVDVVSKQQTVSQNKAVFAENEKIATKEGE